MKFKTQNNVWCHIAILPLFKSPQNYCSLSVFTLHQPIFQLSGAWISNFPCFSVRSLIEKKYIIIVEKFPKVEFLPKWNFQILDSTLKYVVRGATNTNKSCWLQSTPTLNKIPCKTKNILHVIIDKCHSWFSLALKTKSRSQLHIHNCCFYKWAQKTRHVLYQ